MDIIKTETVNDLDEARRKRKRVIGPLLERARNKSKAEKVSNDTEAVEQILEDHAKRFDRSRPPPP